MRWSNEEDELLKNNYQLKKKDLLILFPNRSAASINIRASLLGLRKISNEYCESDLSILLNNTIESYYWIGFILADGCFTGPNSNRLKITLAEKDENHLIKLSVFLKTKITKRNRQYPNQNIVSITCQDKYNCPKIRNKFDFKQAKTYNPPTFVPNASSELIMAMFCGIIDGDGNIGKQFGRKDHMIRIKVHSSWENYFNNIDKILFKSKNRTKINNKGYLTYSIYKKECLNLIVNFINKFQPPILNRKWDELIQEYKDRKEGIFCGKNNCNK